MPRKIAVSPEENTLALIGDSPLIYMFYLNNKEEHHQSYCLPVGCEGVSDICFLKGERILLLGTEGLLYCIDANQDNRVLFTKCLPGRKPIVSFTINRKNRFLLAIAESGEVYLFDFVKLMAGIEKAHHRRTETGLTNDLVYQTLKPALNPITNKTTSKQPYDPLKSLAEDSQPIEYYPSDIETPNEVLPKKPQWYREQENQDLNRENESYLRSSGKKQSFQRQESADSLEDISRSAYIYNSQQLTLDLQNLSKAYLADWIGKHGVFPADQRIHVWKFLLELPINNKAFNALISKGIHPKFENFFEQYPRSELSIKVQETLSCLAFYNEAFTQVGFLPDMIFPFVKVFGENEIICFEIILTFFIHWGQHFFQNNTKPSEFLFTTFEKILEFHEPYLYEHLKNLLTGPDGMSIGDIFWIFTQNIFTDILNREDWHALTDFLVLHRAQPKFLLYFPVAYFSFFKDLLLDEQEKENILDIRYFMERKPDVNIYKIIETMTVYTEKTPHSVFQVSFLNSLPLTKGTYPMLDFYTPNTKDHYTHMQTYIETAEKKREERKEQLKEVFGRLEDIKNLSATFEAKQKPRTLHRDVLLEKKAKDEERSLKRKQELEQAARDRRLLQIQEMEDEMKRCLERQEKIRQEMFAELEKEKELKKQIEEERIQWRLQEEELRQQELEAIQKDNENLELRYEREREREEKLETLKKQREEDLQEAALRKQIRAEEDEYQMQRSLEKRRREQEERLERARDHIREKSMNTMVDAFEREMQRNEFEREKKLEQLRRSNEMSSTGFRSAAAQDPSVSFTQYRGGESGEKRSSDYLHTRKEEQRSFRAESGEKRSSDYFKEQRSFHHHDSDREQVVQKGRERMKILGEERENLLRDLEESKRRLRDLNLEKKKKEELRRIREESRITDQSRLDNSSLQYEEERRLQEIEREYMNKEQIEQEKQDFERTLKETEKRILEQDKMNYEQLREATRQQMISIDEGQRKSVGGRNVSFDYSREEDRSRKGNLSRVDETLDEKREERTKNRYGVRIDTGEDDDNDDETRKYTSQNRSN